MMFGTYADREVCRRDGRHVSLGMFCKMFELAQALKRQGAEAEEGFPIGMDEEEIGDEDAEFRERV